MKKIQWEYKLIERKNKNASIAEIESMLNQMGDRGFELATVFKDYTSGNEILVFKKPKGLIQ